MKTNALTEWISRINITKPSFGQIIFSFAGFAWVIYIFSRGYQLLGVIVTIFLLLAILRVPYLVPVSALVTVAVLFRAPIVNTWTELIQFDKTVLQNPREVLTNLFTPASGMEGLPEDALEAISLMQSHQIDRYQLSNQILQDVSVTQRITEMAWPGRIDQSSPYIIIFLKEEKEYPTCTVIDKQKEIALEYCH